MESTLRRTWAEIDLDALAHNYRTLRAHVGPAVKFLGVVKADGYGHGAIQVSRTLEALGADYLAVACVEEAAQLRESGITAPILILGATPPEGMSLVVELGATQTVFDQSGAQALSRAAVAAGRQAKLHIKLDTGMSRLGFAAREGEMEASAAESAWNWRRPPLPRFLCLRKREPRVALSHSLTSKTGKKPVGTEKYSPVSTKSPRSQGFQMKFPSRSKNVMSIASL